MKKAYCIINKFSLLITLLFLILSYSALFPVSSFGDEQSFSNLISSDSAANVQDDGVLDDGAFESSRDQIPSASNEDALSDTPGTPNSSMMVSETDNSESSESDKEMSETQVATKVKTGWQFDSGGTWYYLDSDGIMLKGLQTIDGCEYYFMESGEMKGAMKTGWQMLDGVWYYFANWGGMEKDKWINLGGTYYFLDQNGAMLTGWQEYNGNTYYLDASGAMVTGWKEIDGQWYHFANWGGMQTDWISLGGTWYYLDSDGIMQTGFQTIDGELYYLSETGNYKGSMWTNCQIRLEGNTCGYASAWGAIFRLGVYDGDRVILTKENGEILSGWQYIGNRWFYGEPGTGVMHIGWLKLGSTWYYLSSSGAMVTGWQTIDGKSYYFTSSGVWVDGGAMAIKAQGYTSGTNYLIMVDCSAHKVGVFRGSVNNWSLQYSWRCVTGAPSTPTIKGTFHTTGFKRNSLSTDSRAIYCTQIWGGYFFHSILASESELGQSLSHGCIRLPYSAAQWIHSNIYAGTTVVIYN